MLVARKTRMCTNKQVVIKRKYVKLSYEKSIIGFIDILGFGQLVYDSEQDEKKFSLIQTVLKKLNEVNDIYSSPAAFFAHSNYSTLSDDFKRDLDEIYEEMKSAAEPERVKITTFSDSIVFSCTATSNGLSNFRYFLIKLLVETSEYQLLLRGGITCGPLLHSDDMIFGPAMNQAYYLESKLSKYPRIIIDTDFSYFLGTLAHEPLAEQIKSELLFDEFDSVTYFDLLSLATNKVAQNMCGANAYEILENEKRTIENLLMSTEDKYIRSKLIWYASYFNEYLVKNPEVEVTITELQGMPLETITVPVSSLVVEYA